MALFPSGPISRLLSEPICRSSWSTPGRHQLIEGSLCGCQWTCGSSWPCRIRREASRFRVRIQEKVSRRKLYGQSEPSLSYEITALDRGVAGRGRPAHLALLYEDRRDDGEHPSPSACSRSTNRSRLGRVIPVLGPPAKDVSEAMPVPDGVASDWKPPTAYQSQQALRGSTPTHVISKNRVEVSQTPSTGHRRTDLRGGSR
jgi:hypothetical protein